MKNYIQRGETVTVTAPYTVLSGGGLLVAGTGHIVGVAVNNQSSGDSTEVLTEGVFGVAALTTPSGVNAPGGLSGDPTVRVRLNQSF